jgi:hypothetical protein
MYKEGQYEVARQRFMDAMGVIGYQAELQYNIALCYYKVSGVACMTSPTCRPLIPCEHCDVRRTRLGGMAIAAAMHMPMWTHQPSVTVSSPGEAVRPGTQAHSRDH